MIERHVYVVDDDDGLRASVEMLLEAAGGFVTLGFASGETFLQDLARLEAGCVLLDLNMPGLNGLEVLRLLRQRDRRFETILLTGQGDIGIAVEAMKAGAIDFIEKPYDNVCCSVRWPPASPGSRTASARKVRSSRRAKGSSGSPRASATCCWA